MTKNSKKELNNLFEDSFPELTLLVPNKYYLIIEPVIIGIEFIKIPRSENYRPCFLIYPLWKESLKLCFDKPILMQQFYLKNGNQISISFSENNNDFLEILKDLKKQIPFDLDCDLNLSSLFLAIEQYSKMPPLSASPNSFLQASLIESKLEIALCVGNMQAVQNELNQIKKRDWKLENFALWNINFDKWLKSIESKIKNRDILISNIEKNIQDKKLFKLKRFKTI